MRVLIVDDDLSLIESLNSALKKNYAIDSTLTAAEGEYLALTNDYDLMLLDYNLPDQTGIKLCQTLRASNCHFPILMLTGRSEVTDKIMALDSGIDDYLIKPFSAPELQARMRAVLRRSTVLHAQNILSYKDLTLDLNTGEVAKNTQSISLRRKEQHILEYLLRHKGQIVKRDMLREHIWESNCEPETNSIDVHITQLRKKLHLRKESSPFIKSIYGLGYQLI